jgi:NAD(P)H-hydrate repair Nnr-like enzyme with NAD(P)H-hydrate dehydratase domain
MPSVRSKPDSAAKMENFPYWLQQTPARPLFPDIQWNKPEQRLRAGKLGIIGGNKLGFVAAQDAYANALDGGVGQVRVLLPDMLKKSVPPVITDIAFAASNPSGGLSREAFADMHALGNWGDGVLLIGDAGKNSETAIVYEDFIRQYSGPLTITRDAVDLLLNSPEALVERDDTLLVMSFAQLQKLFTKVYYPKILTFSMQLQQLVEALHKFTITYPVSVVTFHQDTIVIASGGQVATMPWDNPLSIWKGTVATNASAYWIWNPKKPLEAATASLIL